MGEKKTKEKIKEIIRKIAPKNNKVTREIADKLPYVVLGMAVGAILLHSWVGQPTMIKGKVRVPDEEIYPENTPEEVLEIEDPMYLNGEIGSWGELKKHSGKTIALKVIVVDAATIEKEGPYENLHELP